MFICQYQRVRFKYVHISLNYTAMYLRMSNIKQHTIHDPLVPEKYNNTMLKYEATFYSRRMSMSTSGQRQVKKRTFF